MEDEAAASDAELQRFPDTISPGGGEAGSPLDADADDEAVSGEEGAVPFIVERVSEPSSSGGGAGGDGDAQVSLVNVDVVEAVVVCLERGVTERHYAFFDSSSLFVNKLCLIHSAKLRLLWLYIYQLPKLGS